MIIDGTSINAEQSIESSNAVQSLTQLTVFNSVKWKRKQTSDMYHSHGTETALPLYIGLLLHNKTRKRELIDIFFEHGLSVSYDRVLQVFSRYG